MATRTESNIVQVAPAYENAMVKHMELFGWSLQGRQEIHEEGDTTGGPSFLGDEYVVKTKVSRYVKLHFARSRDLANLDRIHALEAEYNGIEMPNVPPLIPPGGLIGLIGFLFWYPIWPFYYFFFYKKRKEEADAQLPGLNKRLQAILQEVANLLG